ncbi:hypothetical protein [Streptomyces sp. NPDC059468]|uniref:hypothetical protein n=1 Tax=Streptomyces sp. NPDC059468 TaxID=3346845 RepID=UPI0036BD8E1D
MYFAGATDKNGNGTGTAGTYNASLSRGWIITDKAIKGTKYRCNFLYNPSVVTLTHSINTNVLADQNSIDPNDVSASKAILPLSQTVQFDLLFDRTYELWDSSQVANSYDVATMGVAYDVLSLYKITGIASNINVPDGDASTKLSDTDLSYTKGSFTKGAAGPMMWVPVFVVFGDYLDYYGVIQELDVQYTHWTSSMIPVRCQVSITMQLLPRQTAKGDAGRWKPTGKLPGVPDYKNPSILNPQNNKSGKAGR